VGGDERGYDGAKKVKGRKRHILVDTQELVLQAWVHAAQIQDREGIKLLLDTNASVFQSASLSCSWMPATPARTKAPSLGVKDAGLDGGDR
jgi:hypothetical protein